MTGRRKPNLGTAAGRRLCLGSVRIIASPAATDGPVSTSPHSLSPESDIGVAVASSLLRYRQCTSCWHSYLLKSTVYAYLLTPVLLFPGLLHNSGERSRWAWPDASSTVPLIRLQRVRPRGATPTPDDRIPPTAQFHRLQSAPYAPFPLAGHTSGLQVRLSSSHGRQDNHMNGIEHYHLPGNSQH